MATKEVFHGVPGILRPFKEFIEKKGLKKGDQIVYYGVPGTCMPFVELLAFALRSLELEQVFVPFVDESRAKKIGHVDDVGMQARFGPVTLKPKAIVIMGGLSMPDVPVKAEQVKAVIEQTCRCSTHRGLFHAYVRESRVAKYHHLRLPDRCEYRPGRGNNE